MYYPTERFGDRGGDYCPASEQFTAGLWPSCLASLAIPMTGNVPPASPLGWSLQPFLGARTLSPVPQPPTPLSATRRRYKVDFSGHLHFGHNCCHARGSKTMTVSEAKTVPLGAVSEIHKDVCLFIYLFVTVVCVCVCNLFIYKHQVIFVCF